MTEEEKSKSSSQEESSSDFSLELVVDKAKKDEETPENAVDMNIYDFNIDSIKDKPWLKPGADITDYFNYGFTERTWRKYCEMQREMRAFVEREEGPSDRQVFEQMNEGRQENKYETRNGMRNDEESRYNHKKEDNYESKYDQRREEEYAHRHIQREDSGYDKRSIQRNEEGYKNDRSHRRYDDRYDRRGGDKRRRLEDDRYTRNHRRY